MKNLNLIAFKIVIVTILVLPSLLLSCRKDETSAVIQSKNDEVSVSNLKEYLSGLTGVDTTKIEYDVESKKFITSNFEISLNELTKTYRQFEIVRYKDGATTNNK